MKYFVMALVLVPIAIMVGCAGSAPGPGPDVDDIPEWYMNPPSDPNYLFSAQTETSTKMQLAVDKAKLAGRKAIADQLEVKIEGLTKKFDEEIGFGEDAELLSSFTSVAKSVTSTTLYGCKASKQEINNEKSGFRAYVLMEVSFIEAKAGLRDGIKAKKNLYTRFRASESFKELEKEVEKFEEYKKDQGMR